MELNFTIIRRKNDNNFEFMNRKTGEKVKDDEISNIIQYYIPPAWDPVYINDKKNAKCYAVGIDIKGKKQYLYHKQWLEKSEKKKYQQMLLFAKVFQRLKKKMYQGFHMIHTAKETCLDRNDVKELLLSVALYLIIHCNFRVGTKTNSEAFGVSTLEKKHFILCKNQIVVSFIGKKGIENKSLIKDKKINTIIQQLLIQNETDKFFDFQNGSLQVKITARTINKFIKKFGDFSSKDIRTYQANALFLKYIKKNAPKFTNKGKLIKHCIQKTAMNLHHTEKICKKSYICKEILNQVFESNGYQEKLL